jgi:hypothetical protein
MVECACEGTWTAGGVGVDITKGCPRPRGKKVVDGSGGIRRLQLSSVCKGVW